MARAFCVSKPLAFKRRNRAVFGSLVVDFKRRKTGYGGGAVYNDDLIISKVNQNRQAISEP